jgi:hypothetical protein
LWYAGVKVGGPSELTAPDKGVLVMLRALNLKPVDIGRGYHNARFVEFGQNSVIVNHTLNVNN